MVLEEFGASEVLPIVHLCNFVPVTSSVGIPGLLTLSLGGDTW